MQRDGPIRHRHDVLRADEAREVGLEAINEFSLRRNPGALEALQDVLLLVTAELRPVNGNSDGGKGRTHRRIIVRWTHAESIASHFVAWPSRGPWRCERVPRAYFLWWHGRISPGQRCDGKNRIQEFDAGSSSYIPLHKAPNVI